MIGKKFDVIVAGGGSAGVAAAVGSAQCGARTLLIERYSCLGGASTMRNVVTYCGLYTLESTPKLVVGGVAEKVLAALAQRKAITTPQRHRGVFVVFEPEAVKIVLDEVCAEAGVKVMLGGFVAAARRQDDKLVSLSVADHAGLHEIEADAFVDCTGEGDLLSLGGAATRYGNAGAVNLGTLAIRFGGIPKSVVVSALDIAAAIARLGDVKNQLTKDRSIVARLPVSGDVVCYLASVDYDPRDALEMSFAERNGREQAWLYLDVLRSLPGCEGAYLVSTGPEFGTRESRHIESNRQLRWADIDAKRRFNDCIALGAWGAEWHDRHSYESTFEFPADKIAYDIPLSCLVSRNTKKLFAAGRLADADRLAGAAIRVMGTAFATGHAAGVAAALSVSSDNLDAMEVRRTLVNQGAVLERNS